MHPAIDQVLGLVLVRAISSKDSTIRQMQNTCICAIFSGQRLCYTFGESCACTQMQCKSIISDLHGLFSINFEHSDQIRLL